MGQVRAAIDHLDADVVVLQGVAYDRRINIKNQAEQLAEILTDYPFSHYEPMSTTGGVTESLAVLSKVAPSDVFVHRLSRRPEVTDTDRVLMHAAFSFADGRAFNVFNVNLSPVYEQAFDNIRDLMLYVNAFELPGLIIGDFNRPHNSPLMANMREGGWSDAYTTLLPNDDGYTFESPNPTVRRTQAWVKGIEPKKARVIMSETNDIRMSGHRGLYISWE